MSESIWKTEIHLRRRKAKAVAPPPPAPAAEEKQPATSVWKKEIKVGRRKAKAVSPPPPAPAAEEKPSTSVWKKEIRLGRSRGTVVVPVLPDVTEGQSSIERWPARTVERRVEFPKPAQRDEHEPVSFLPAARETIAPVPEASLEDQFDAWRAPQPEPDGVSDTEVPDTPDEPEPHPWSWSAQPAAPEPAETHELGSPAANQVQAWSSSPLEVPEPERDEPRPWEPAVAPRETDELGSPAANQVQAWSASPLEVPEPERDEPRLWEPAVASPDTDDLASPAASERETSSPPPEAPKPDRDEPHPGEPPVAPRETDELGSPAANQVQAWSSSPLEVPEPERDEPRLWEPAVASPDTDDLASPAASERETSSPPPEAPKPERDEPRPWERAVAPWEADELSSPAANQVQASSVPVSEPNEPEPGPQAVPEPKPRGLKRELRLPRRRRKPKADKPEKKAEKTEPPAPEPRVSPLKKELHLPRRRRKAKSANGVTRVVGLRIGSSQLSAAHVENNGSAEVVQLARMPIERGLVVAGEVREPAALAKALKSFFASNKLPHKDIRLGIASNRIGVRMLEVPAVDDPKQFENAIRFRAQELLPIPVADAVLDHIVLSEAKTPEGDAMRRILLVFAHRELIGRYVDVCRQAGLRLTGIDFDAFALLRSLAPAPVDGSNQAVVAVAVGHERTVFAVSDGEICEFTRVLDWGGGSIDVAIARALNLTPSQAGPIKHTLALDAAEPPEGLSPMQFEVARAAAKTEVAALVRELISSLRFYQSRPESLALGEVLLAGGGAQLGGFAAELQLGLGAPVRVADPFERVTFAKKVSRPDDPGSLAIAVGLGIEA